MKIYRSLYKLRALPLIGTIGWLCIFCLKTWSKGRSYSPVGAPNVVLAVNELAQAAASASRSIQDSLANAPHLSVDHVAGASAHETYLYLLGRCGSLVRQSETKAIVGHYFIGDNDSVIVLGWMRDDCMNRSESREVAVTTGAQIVRVDTSTGDTTYAKGFLRLPF